jgi:hypothetical protein
MRRSLIPARAQAAWNGFRRSHRWGCLPVAVENANGDHVLIEIKDNGPACLSRTSREFLIASIELTGALARIRRRRPGTLNREMGR